MTKSESNTNLEELSDRALKAIDVSSSLEELDSVRVEFVGKKSALQSLLKSLGSMESDERKEKAPVLQSLRATLLAALDEKMALLKQSLDTKLEPIDLSEPHALQLTGGHMHPTQRILEEVYGIFDHLGFAIVEGPEIETDWYNFEVLNLPPDHPAREMQDTFYIKAEGDTPPLIPRTHTSASQIRYMESHEPPFKIIVPGKVYRNEDEDSTHLWSFYQVEGLVVGEDVSVSDLKGTLLHVMKSLFGPDTKIRLRPSYFPYTEPSFEVDVWYRNAWLEICGAGMVHPDVLRRGGVDPEQYSGFAFGFGPDRLTVIRYGLEDIRLLWRPNLLASTKL